MYGNPICLFPEGTTSNGRCILNFKRGAFISLRTVRPVVAKVSNRYFNPMYDSLEYLPCLIMYVSSLCMYNLHLTIMPEFKPTYWMLNQHKDKGKTAYEVYAQCVREAMAETGGLMLEDRPIKAKLAYEDFMYGYTDEITINGKTFTYQNTA